MINEEKVILMTHASLYENGEGQETDEDRRLLQT